MHSSTSPFIALGAEKVVGCSLLRLYLSKALCGFSCSGVSASLQLWDSSPPGLSVPGIVQERTLARLASSSCRGSSQPRGGACVSCISCIAWQILYLRATWAAHYSTRRTSMTDRLATQKIIFLSHRTSKGEQAVYYEDISRKGVKRRKKAGIFLSDG